MYLCVCNKITEKMLEENSSLAHKIGSKCGICIKDQKIITEQITYLREQSS